MDIINKSITAASGALKFLFNIQQDDNILILTDTHSLTVANAFRLASVKMGCSVEIFEIKNRARPFSEIPAELEKLLSGKTIVLNIIRAYPEEIAFRIKWIFKVEENKLIKMGHMPGITKEMMLNSVNVDFGKMKTLASRLVGRFKDAVQVHITTDDGTDVFLGVAGRRLIDDVGAGPGEMCNIPCGEVYCAPIETEADGLIVFDASIGDIGVLVHPLKVYVSKGSITKFESEDTELVKRISELTNIDQDAMVIGELGIGINPGARITGNMLEDEKSLGTAHIAFGNNADFPGGGNNHSKIHRDFLFFNPTIEVRYSDGKSNLLMKNGEFILGS